MTSYINNSELRQMDWNNVSEDAKQMLVASKIDIVRKFPFLGHLIMTTEWIFSDEVVAMGATTIPSNQVHISENFILNKVTDMPVPTRKHVNFIVIHEMLHIFLEHIGRQVERTYNPDLWNVATDYMINLYIEALNSNILLRPEWVLFDTRFTDKSADEIYQILLDENDGDAKQAARANGANVDDDGEDGQDGDEDGQDGDGQGNGQGNGQGQGKQKSAGKGNGQRPVDHVSAEQQSDQSKTCNGQQISAAMNTCPDGGSSMGNGAMELINRLNDIIESVIPWQDVLSEFVTSSAKNRSTYNRISRRSTGGICFPTMDGNAINICYGIDSSGSMGSKDYLDANSEIAGILESFDDWVANIITCDTNVHTIGMYASEEDDTFDDIDMNIVGGGGTNMGVMVDYVNNDIDEEDLPACLVIVTDGYIPPTPPSEIPTIILVTTNGNKDLKLEHATVLFMSNQ